MNVGLHAARMRKARKGVDGEEQEAVVNEVIKEGLSEEVLKGRNKVGSGLILPPASQEIQTHYLTSKQGFGNCSQRENVFPL